MVNSSSRHVYHALVSSSGLIIEQGVEADVYLVDDRQTTTYTTFFVCQVQAGARVTIFQEQSAHLTYEHNLQVSIVAEQGAQVQWFALLHGGQQEYELFLRGSGAYIQLYCLCLLDQMHQLTLVTRHYHEQAHTRSCFLGKSMLYDAAQMSWDGTVAIMPEACYAMADQHQKTLLLSNRAHARSMPRLEIQTNEVHCKHGSAVGTFDQEQLFYLQARGLTYEQAQQIMLVAFCAEIINVLPDMVVRTRWLARLGIIHENATQRLSHF